jgi:hypothetical protein
MKTLLAGSAVGTQFTNTSQWNAAGSQNFVLPSGWFYDNHWGGTLNY